MARRFAKSSTSRLQFHSVLFEAPITQSAENYNWKGHHSTHILEKGWEQIIEEMRVHNFAKVFSEKDTVIFNRV